VKVTLLDHEVIMEEAGKRDRSTMSTMTMTAIRARKRVRRRARRRAMRRVRRKASRAMVSSSRASTARGTRMMMLLLSSLCAR